jgi:monothiol glutaredoxin
MSLTPELRMRIETLLAQHPVVLFMKGTRAAPRCGFSAGAVRTLAAVTPDFHDVDVIDDPEIREAIKVFGQWPTIPQLYVRGELVGGADILNDLANSGALHELLGLAKPDRTPPTIRISAAAAAALRAATLDAGDEVLHLGIDEHFRAQFFLKPASAHDIVARDTDVAIHMDLGTAPRAQGLEIDWVETAQGAGLSLRNPNAPAPVKPIEVEALAQSLDQGALQVVDVRPAAPRTFAPFAGARVLEDEETALMALPKDTPLAFLCHHGQSSRVAAERFRAAGFQHLFNVEGGIDAWSQRIDPGVPRY